MTGPGRGSDLIIRVYFPPSNFVARGGKPVGARLSFGTIAILKGNPPSRRGPFFREIGSNG